jgi:hypothetical protein
VRQEYFREAIREHLATMLDEQEMFELADCVLGEWDNEKLDKAFNEAYYSLDRALKKLSRLAVRLEYLEKDAN